MNTLECDHCGDAAIEADKRGMFTDGDGDRCNSCGYPGQVMVDDSGEEEDNIAYWSISDDVDSVCNRPDCEECKEFRK